MILSLRYLHLDEGIFCRVRRLAWCNDPESYAGASIATGRVTLAGQVKGEHPDKERYPGPPGWGLGVLLATSHCKKSVDAKVQQGYSGQMKGRVKAEKSGVKLLNRPIPTQGLKSIEKGEEEVGPKTLVCRSQWPSCLRLVSTADRLLGLRV